MLFVVGGRDANISASKIQLECEKKDLACAVVAVPKSMDNAIGMVSCPLPLQVFKCASLTPLHFLQRMVDVTAGDTAHANM